MKAIAVVGNSKTGKTTLCEAVIAALSRRGYRVESIKEIHSDSFAMDDPHTNTGRHRAAGAKLVAARGQRETDLLFPEKLPMRVLLSFFHCDYLILEGVRDVLCPMILSAAGEEDLPKALDGRVVAVSGVIANSGAKEVRGLPVLNPLSDDPDALADFVEAHAFLPLPDVDPACCGKCGQDCASFCIDVARGRRRREECAQFDQEVTLLMGDRQLHLVPFVERILKNTLLGLVRELEGYDPHGEITLTIRGGRE